MMTTNVLTEALFGASADAAAGFAGSMLLRGIALLALAGGSALLLRRGSAALRHHVWMLAMAGLLALPLLTRALPDWNVSVPASVSSLWPTGIDRIEGTEARRGTASAAELDGPAPDSRSPELATTSTPATTGGPDSRAGAFSFDAPEWGELLFAAWFVGCLFLAVRLGTGLVRAARLVRRARPVTDRQWNVLVSLLSLKTGLGRGVRVVSSPEVNVPMAWGILGRWLVLPEDFEDWPAERRRVVVLHELAHLRRRDCVAQAVARLALALHWPNPLAWVAARRMTAEREQACDDAVITAGVGGPSYAHHLVEIARGLSRSVRPTGAAVAMARPSELENRVLAILDERRSRRTVGRRTTRMALAGTAALLLPVALVQPSGARAAAEPPEGGTPTIRRDVEPETPVAMADPDPAGDAGAAMTTKKSKTTETDTREQVEQVSNEADLTSILAALDLKQSAAGDTIEERVYQALSRALASDDPEVRKQVAHTLGTIESARGVGLLAPLVTDDDDAGVREQAAWALGMIESAEGVPALARATRDSSDDVREQAAWAIGMIESADGVDPLLALLDDANPAVRNQAAWGLGMIESSSAVSGLASAFATESSAEVRSQIVWALGMIEDREAADTIVDALEDPDPDVRKQALWAIGQVLN